MGCVTGMNCCMDFQSLRAWCMMALNLQVIAGIAVVVISQYYLSDDDNGAAGKAWADNVSAAWAAFILGTILAYAVVLPITPSTSRVWYRGGIYKIIQLLIILSNVIIWTIAASMFTSTYLDYNDDKNNDELWQQCTVFVLAWCCVGLGVIALTCRILAKGGSVKRRELNKLQAEVEANERKRNAIPGSRPGTVYTEFNGQTVLLNEKDIEKAVFLEHEIFYDSGYSPDAYDPNDVIFIPKHPYILGRYVFYPRKYQIETDKILHQGSRGTCSVHAVVCAYRQTVKKEKGVSFDPSRLFIYYNARVKIVGKNPKEDGAYLRACCKALNHYGCCSEKTWSYEGNPSDRQPSAAAYAEAKLHRVSYQKVEQDEYSIIAALAQGHPIICAFKYLKREFQSVNRQQPYMWFPYDARKRERILRMAPGETDCHAITIVGYDAKNRWFTVQNSWGEEWAMGGKFYIDFNYITDPFLTVDLWIFRYAN